MVQYIWTQIMIDMEDNGYMVFSTKLMTHFCSMLLGHITQQKVNITRGEQGRLSDTKMSSIFAM